MWFVVKSFCGGGGVLSGVGGMVDCCGCACVGVGVVGFLWYVGEDCCVSFHVASLWVCLCVRVSVCVAF